jgi:hypothetical protein
MAYTTIDDPEAYFQIKLYTGNGGTQSITLDGDTDMQPDMVWIKCRSDADDHTITDAVRGNTKAIYPNTTGAEATSTIRITAFDSDGFSLGASGDTNTNTRTFVAWCWKETATAGFDIVAYEGTGSARTVSHSLSAVPHMMHIKNRENTGGGGTEGWLAYHKAVGATKSAGHLNSTGVPHDHTDYFNDVEPTSSVFTVGAGDNGNNSGEDNIAYLWTSIQGFSKFGSYTGNGSADGTFVYTGFRPAFVVIKQTNSTGNWMLWDSKRLGYNPDQNEMYANTNHAEQTDDRIDLFSNGFKLLENTAGFNGSGDTHIFMAFAEAPFVNSNGVPCNAR